jgi:hypothetical protein
MKREITIQRVKGGFALVSTGQMGTTEFTLIKGEVELTSRLQSLNSQAQAAGDELEVTVDEDADAAMKEAIAKVVPPKAAPPAAS